MQNKIKQMSLQCDIVYKDNGEIDYVKTANGQPSQLFNELSEMMGGDKQSALNLYALTESEDFKTINNDRISQGEKQESNRGGEIATESTNLLRREVGTNEKNTSGRQKSILEKFAKKEGLWIKDYKKLGEYVGKGMESEVFLSPDGNTVYKANDLEFYDTPLDFLNTIDKHNELFPEAPYKVIGFTQREDSKNFAFVVEQPFVQADRGATQEEVDEELEKLGFKKGVSGEVFTKENITILDLHEGNVVTDGKGNIFFIDPVIFVEEVKQTPLREEPTVEDVMQYATSIQRGLTDKQKIDLQDVIMGLGIDNSLQAEALLEEALVKDGIVIFDKKKMEGSGVFTSFETKQILNSPEKQKQIKEALQALKNTDLIEVEYPRDYVFANGTKLNIFGKQEIKNPFLLQKEIIDNQEVPDGMDESAENLFEGVMSAQVKTVVEGELVDKTDGTDTQTILEQTIIDDYNERLADNLNFVTEGFSATVWESKKEAVSKIVKQIKEDAINNGIDLKNIEEKVFTKSRQEIIDFFNSMEDFLESGEAEDFAVQYNEMFDLNTPLTQSIKTDNEFDVVMEDVISEYEAFSKYNLIKKSPNIYRKVEDMSLDEMYTITATNEGKPVEEVQREVRDNPLDVVDFEVETDNLEKMQLWKKYFNFPMQIPTTAVEKQEDGYIRKANKWLLKSKNPYYKITINGLELVSNDTITQARGELTLPETLKIIKEVPQIERDVQAERRQEVFDNPTSIPKLNGDYLYVDPEVLAVRNEVLGFIRTPKGVYELIHRQGNISFYGKLNTPKVKPLSDINFDDLGYLETTPEQFKKSKAYYTKQELEDINNKNFNC